MGLTNVYRCHGNRVRALGLHSDALSSLKCLDIAARPRSSPIAYSIRNWTTMEHEGGGGATCKRPRAFPDDANARPGKPTKSPIRDTVDGIPNGIPKRATNVA